MRKYFVFVLSLLAACGAARAQVQAQGTEAWHAVADARGVQVIYVECGENFFDPPEIVVKGNRPVELLLRTQEASQEFVLDLTPGLGKAIGKQRSTHRFTPTAQGHFAMGCQKQGGAGKGKKKGLLTVVPDNGKND